MFKLLAGLVTPKKMSGKIALKNFISERGVPVEKIPEFILDDIVDTQLGTAKMFKEPGISVTESFVERLIGDAEYIEQWWKYPDSKYTNEPLFSSFKTLLDENVVRNTN